MRHGSLFSGIGGFDLAAQWMGWENVFHCEWNSFGQKVLHHYWPNAETFTDITKSDFKKYNGTIDIISGGFPCQPYSQAGKRLGKEDERHLWPEMLRAIREIQPGWVVGENVRGLTNWNGGLVFDEVQSDLENQGYEVTPFLLPACAVNAPHRRDRIWFVAYSEIRGLERQWKPGKVTGFKGDFGTVCFDERTSPQDISNTDCIGQGGGCKQPITTKQGHNIWGHTTGIATDTYGGRQPFEKYGEKETGRIAEKSLPDDWSNFPTQSPIRYGNDGFPTGLDTSTISFPKWRNESIKAGGNAIVPQVAYEIFKAIQAYETQHQLK